MPAFDGVSVPGDDAWHEVVLKLTDSPFLELTQDVVALTLRPFAPRRSIFVAPAEPLTGDEHFDVARIELVRIVEPTLRPTVSAVRPGRSVPGREVTIDGSGFAEPAERNVVLFGDGEYWHEADILGGNATSLQIRVPRWQERKALVELRTPGGERAVGPQPFILFRDDAAWNAVLSGTGQRAIVGSEVPLSIRLDQFGYGAAGERVGFRLIWGEGSLSTLEAVTDDEGVATTVLTLGSAVGPLVVEPTGRFVQQYFVVFALPGDKPARLPEAVFGENGTDGVPGVVTWICERALTDDSPAVRSAAAAILARQAADSGSMATDALSALRELLGDGEADVRVSAALALGWMGGDAVRGRLREVATQDPDARVRRAATIGDPWPVVSGTNPAIPAPGLIDALRDPDRRFREAAARALGRVAFRGVAVRSPLLEVMGDASPAVRRAVFAALGNTQPAVPATVIALLAGCNDPAATVRAAAIKAILSLSYPRRADRAASRNDVSSASDAEIHALVSLLAHDDANVRVIAAIALGQTGTKPVVVRSAIIRLLATLYDAEPRVRSASIQTLGQIGLPAAAGLERILRGDNVEASGVAAIGLASVSVGTSILTRALSDSRGHVRAAAADGLARMGPRASAAAPRLLRALRDEDPGVRYKSAWALDRLGLAAKTAATSELARAHPALGAASRRIKPGMQDAEPFLSLLQAVIEGTPSTRASAAYLLSRTDRLAVDEALRDGLAHRDGNVREKAFRLLSELLLFDSYYAQQLWTQDAIALSYGDRDPRVRRAVAVAHAATISPPLWSDRPLFWLLDDPDSGNREFAASRLATPGPLPGAAIPALVDALEHGTPRLRAEAARALARMGSRASSATVALEAACASTKDTAAGTAICAALEAVRKR